ncbi:hypothetical protein D6D01_01833 [Aureobasidium pullulans]|uniref:Uncharacterized protein n=1 Tax=Aureobasidium pullulans TaxID=5580 RepID=A0A4S9LYT1_AURPU|nr:hypothetical protein D6D01_01833 [Aureobasidium pullulans]
MFTSGHMTRDVEPEIYILVDHIPIHSAPCECGSCEQQFIRKELQNKTLYMYEAVVPAVDAKSLLSRYTTQINTDRAYLADRCDRFGDTILSRWRKKSYNKRETLILQADSTIEKEAWFRLRIDGVGMLWQDVRKQHRNQWLLPYMSTEIMKSNPSVLLGLIYNRVRYSPEEWAPFDSDLIREGFSSGQLGLEYCGHYGVLMHGVEYGKLVPWNKEAAERWDIIGYPRARLIVEAQALMFSRLRSIVDLILDRVNTLDSMRASDKWQQTMRAGSKQSGRVELWSDYINQPFSRPPQFDVDYYCSVAKARMQAAEDHLWLLQTDLSYTRRFIKLMAVGEAYTTGWKHELIAQDMHLCMEEYMLWQELNEAWSCVRDHYRRFRDNIYPGQPLPHRLEPNLALLELALLRNMEKRVRHLSAHVPQRPGFQHLYKITMNTDETGLSRGRIDRACQTPTNVLYYADPLDWIVGQLRCHPDEEHRFDHAELFARPEAHLAEANAEERGRFDETIYEKMSSFAALHEMLSAVRLHRPAFNFRDEKGLHDLLKLNSTAFTRRLVPDGAPIRAYPFPSKYLKIFDQTAPASGKKTEEWLERRTAERRALGTFWNQARETLRLELQSKLAIGERAPKPKTRPSEPVNHQASIVEPLTSKEVLKSQIPTTTRALDLVKKMYPITAGEATANVDWDLFVHSMADLNFNARNVGGSAVAFDHAASGRKIIFHRPHPVSKIDSVMLQSMGKRLSKHFGWNRDIFVEA